MEAMGVILLMLKMEKHKETPFSRFEDVTLKFLALSVSMIVGHYNVQCCLCSDEAERNETLMISMDTVKLWNFIYL